MMPDDGFGFENLRFGYVDPDGGVSELFDIRGSVTISEDKDELTGLAYADLAAHTRQPQTYTASFTLSHDLERARDVLGDFEHDTTLHDVMFVEKRWHRPLRHKYVWQYRGERKGTKKPRNREVPYEIRTVIPNVRMERLKPNVTCLTS